MSTLYMDLLWRDLRGEASEFTPREERIRRGFIEEWSFAETYTTSFANAADEIADFKDGGWEEYQCET